jgi:hypothetical protein
LMFTIVTFDFSTSIIFNLLVTMDHWQYFANCIRDVKRV